jgi:DNA polymerase elongation subunit (family B)
MSRLILDIETSGADFELLDPAVQDYLLRWTETPEDIEKVKQSLSFYPQTAEIIALGMLNPDTNNGRVYFQAPAKKIQSFQQDGIIFESGTEYEILTSFWNTIKSYDKLITFNGRGFDCPFIIIRSAVNKIKPTKELLPNRYSDLHIDLLDQLSFYGASKRRVSLDIWCKTFSIKSPKSNGITGYEIKDLFMSERYEDIARYCAGDLRATKELLSVWENYIRFQG